MYIAHDCIKCKRKFLLLEQDLVDLRELDKEVYIVCPYCSSRQIKVSNKYENLKQCMEEANTFKKEHGKIKRIR